MLTRTENHVNMPKILQVTIYITVEVAPGGALVALSSLWRGGRGNGAGTQSLYVAYLQMLLKIIV